MFVLTSDNGPTAWRHYYRKGPNVAPGSTAGFRGRKWSLYEGGIRMPLIVRWKGTIPAGRVDDSSVLAAVDFFPTLSRLAKVTPPRVEFDGIDAGHVFLGQPLQRETPLFWEYGRNNSYLKPGLELYDFDQATDEAQNVAAQHPATAKRLAKRLLDWRTSLPSLDDAN